MELSPTHSREKSIPVNVLMSQWWISRAMKTVGQSDAKINTAFPQTPVISSQCDIYS